MEAVTLGGIVFAMAFFVTGALCSFAGMARLWSRR